MGKTNFFILVDALTKDGISGIGNVTLNIIRGLSEDSAFVWKYRIRLVVDFDKTKYLKKFRFNENVEIKRNFIPNRLINMLVKLHFELPMDLILGRGIYLFPNFRNYKLAGSKSLTYVHDVAHKIFPKFIEEKNLRMLERMLPKYMERTDKIITISESSKGDILKAYPEVKSKKIAVVLNSVDLGIFKKYSAVEVAEEKRKLGLPEKYFLFLSTIEPRKNLKTLILVFEKAQTNAKLVIIGGKGWKSEEIHGMIAKNPKIIYPTSNFSDTELAKIMNGAMALVHPAWHEGFGLSPLQAIASETPVIVSDIPAMHEVLGEMGVYYGRPDDITGLQKAMENVKAADGRALRKRAEMFSRENMIKQLVRVIDRLGTD